MFICRIFRERIKRPVYDIPTYVSNTFERNFSDLHGITSTFGNGNHFFECVSSCLKVNNRLYKTLKIELHYTFLCGIYDSFKSVYVHLFLSILSHSNTRSSYAARDVWAQYVRSMK